MPVAVEIRLDKATQVLEVAFDDGVRFSLPAEYLRVESPSAEVQGHGPGGKTIVPGAGMLGLLGSSRLGITRCGCCLMICMILAFILGIICTRSGGSGSSAGRTI